MNRYIFRYERILEEEVAVMADTLEEATAVLRQDGHEDAREIARFRPTNIQLVVIEADRV